MYLILNTGSKVMVSLPLTGLNLCLIMIFINLLLDYDVTSCTLDDEVDFPRLLDTVSSNRRDEFSFLCFLASKFDDDDEMELSQISRCRLCCPSSGSCRMGVDGLEQLCGLAELTDGKLRFVNSIVKNFLPSIHYLQQPMMTTIRALTQRLFCIQPGNLALNSDACQVIQFFCGMANSGFSSIASVTAQNLIRLLCLLVDGSRPVQSSVGSDILLLAIKCAFETRNPNTCMLISRECLTSQTLVSHASTEMDSKSAAFFLFHSSQHNHHWTLHCSDSETALENRLKSELKRLGGALIVRHNKNIAKGTVILSTKTREYLSTAIKFLTTNTECGIKACISEQPLAVSDTPGHSSLSSFRHLFHTFSLELLKAVHNPGHVITLLCQEDLIPSSMKRTIHASHGSTHSKSAMALLAAIGSRVQASNNPEHELHKLLTALDKTGEPAVLKVVAQMRNQCQRKHYVDPNESVVPFSFNGCQTSRQYQTRQQIDTSTFFNLFIDAVRPQLQLHSCSKYVEAEYRKMDHVLFKFSQSMRHDFYEHFELSPCTAIHWVKTKQPDGSEETENAYKPQRQTSQNVSSRNPPVAEMVVLNSLMPTLVKANDPVLNDSITIVLQTCSDDCTDQGMIGCDFLKPEYEVDSPQIMTWFESQPFDIKRDEKIGRQLPLPSKTVDLVSSTTMSASLDTLAEQPQGQHEKKAHPNDTNHPSTFTEQSKTTLSMKQIPRLPVTHEEEMNEEQVQISEHQVKRLAVESFNHPGSLFFAQKDNFRLGKVYPLPDSLSSCHVLREGGNGIVMEVKYDGELFAVKKTAFRWREVLIITKLRHGNILQLTAMMMGKPVKSHPKQRYVYQLSPKLTNDLGRSVGSFEKFCLRALNERYSSERLLLRKVNSNFCYVVREVLKALEYLHTRSCPIVHRDVKSSNILVKMLCDCHNPLICVCRRRPGIVLNDFDASIELDRQGRIVADPPHHSLPDFHDSASKVYHVSPVGTVGYKSPEGSQFAIGNHLETMPPLSTKADIFSFGVLMLLMLVNEEGPKHQQQMARLLLSTNQSVGPSMTLSRDKQQILQRSGVIPHHLQVYISEKDVIRVLPLQTIKQQFPPTSALYDFVSRTLAIDPHHCSSASDLLHHEYIASNQSLL